MFFVTILLAGAAALVLFVAFLVRRTGSALATGGGGLGTHLICVAILFSAMGGAVVSIETWLLPIFGRPSASWALVWLHGVIVASLLILGTAILAERFAAACSGRLRAQGAFHRRCAQGFLWLLPIACLTGLLLL